MELGGSFCIHARLVTLLTAILSLAFWFAVTALDILGLLTDRQDQTSEEDKPNEWIHTTFKSLSGGSFFGAAITVFALAFINLACSFLVICGCVKRSKYLLLPWLVWNHIQIASCCVILLVLLVEDPKWITTLPFLGVYVYLWLYVLVCYKEFSETRERDAQIVKQLMS